MWLKQFSRKKKDAAWNVALHCFCYEITWSHDRDGGETVNSADFTPVLGRSDICHKVKGL